MENQKSCVVGMILISVLTVSGYAFGDERESAKSQPLVLIETSLGTIKLELWSDKAPVTVKNFLRYADEGFYDGTVFHRVIKGFMIQGGGLTANLERKGTHKPIENEASPELKNDRGTIAMARTPEIHSATSQFFINLADNAFLNHRDKTPKGYGYTVFGRVIDGMDVVDEIASVKTTTRGSFRDVPETAVLIRRVKQLNAE
jgi:cyclophilin family peptidyl-prolyl cis-trans isomerase